MQTEISDGIEIIKKLDSNIEWLTKFKIDLANYKSIYGEPSVKSVLSHIETLVYARKIVKEMNVSKLQNIKDEQLVARKNRIELGMSAKASLLTTVIGEAEMIGKNSGREVTDVEVIALLKKFEKGMIETLGHLEKRNQISTDETIKVENELVVIRSFLPKSIDDETVKQDIIELNVPFEKKSMGILTKSLRVKYGEQFDGQQVSKIFDTFLVK